MAAETINKTNDSVSSTLANEKYEAFLSRLSPKARATMAKYDENSETRGTNAYGDLWKRLAGLISSLAPQTADMVGFAVKFYIPDGKYRQQVFALETAHKGTVAVYLPDMLNAAVARHLITAGPLANTYQIAGNARGQIHLEPITANTCETVVCKAMVGWGKRAFVTTLDEHSTPEQLQMVEELCRLAAESWAAPKEAAAVGA